MTLILSRLIRQILVNFLELILKDCINVQEQKKKVVVLFSRPPQDVVVVQRRQRNVQKSVMHVQTCGFTNLNLLLFCCFRCRRRRRILSSLLLRKAAGSYQVAIYVFLG